MRTPAEERQGLARLQAALLTDIGWTREHTRVEELAADWLAHGNSAERLLQGDALADAERWLANRPSTALEPTALQRKFIHESRAAELVLLAQERTKLSGAVSLQGISRSKKLPR
jgi:hypothetical protein